MAYDIEQLLVNEANRIGPDIYRKTLNTSPWLKLVKKDVWPDEMGQTIKVLTYERSLPANTLSWSEVNYNTGSGNNCVPSAEVINFGQTLKEFYLTQTALESPPICVNDLRFSLKRKEQLQNIFNILTENASYAWQDRFRDEYTRIAKHKVIATAALAEDEAAFPLAVPTSELTQGILDRYYMKLIRDGAGNNPLSRENARPVFAAIVSSETSRNIIAKNADVRQDYRWSSKADTLLAPLGVERSYAGFFHLIDDFLPRWDFVNGAWVRILPYVEEEADHGTKFVINPAYEDAPFEDSIIFHTDVFTNLVPKPITNPGGNVKFDAVSYMGDFKWRNIPNKQDNPDGLIGFFRAILSSGSKPVRPEWGYVIRHLRCGTPLNLVSCS